MCLEETTAVRVDPMLERTGEEKKTHYWQNCKNQPYESAAQHFLGSQGILDLRPLWF